MCRIHEATKIKERKATEVEGMGLDDEEEDKEERERGEMWGFK